MVINTIFLIQIHKNVLKILILDIIMILYVRIFRKQIKGKDIGLSRLIVLVGLFWGALGVRGREQISNLVLVISANTHYLLKIKS